MLNQCGAFALKRPLSLQPIGLSPLFRSSCQQQRQRCFAFCMSANESNEGPNITPTWEYRGYTPPPPPRGPRRHFSTESWTVPENFAIPDDRIELSFVKSSGAGGQNVNKLSTKVELRFHIDEADWLPKEVRDRIREQQANRINKEGEFSLSCQEHRTQIGNRKDAMAKLKSIILQAWPRPKIRKIRTGVSKEQKERNKENKRINADKKANRKGVDF